MKDTKLPIMAKFKRNRDTKPSFKSGRQEGEGSSQHQTPHFSFEKMQRGTGYSIECCGAEERAALASKLFELSQITWADIARSGRHGTGSEIIERGSFKIALPPFITQDTNLLSFRYNGKKAMVGYRENRVFHVLFLDWNFTVYDHGN